LNHDEHVPFVGMMCTWTARHRHERIPPSFMQSCKLNSFI
jgi:hypothetical protein